MNESVWENSIARKYLQEEGGSKAGAYFYLLDHHPELHDHLPEGTTYLPPGGDIEKFIENVRISYRKIVRGCHARDVEGMVDVIPSYPDLRDTNDIIMAVLNAMNAAASDKVRSYMEYDSEQPYDAEIGLLVQDYYGGERGSIIEHPHEKGVYRIEHIAKRGRIELIDSYMTDETGRVFDMYGASSIPEWEKKYQDQQDLAAERIQRIIGLYRKVQETGLMPSSHSFQMEYGVTASDIMFYQARLFKPFEPKAEFPAQIGAHDDCMKWQYGVFPYNVYGITPEEGIECSLVSLDKEAVEAKKEIESVAYRHRATNNHRSTALDVQPRNMRVYAPLDENIGHEHFNMHLLEHGYFRWMQKSPLTIGGIRKNIHGRVRFFSNGVQGGYSVVES